MPVLLERRASKVIGQHPESPGSFGELFLLTERIARAVADGPSDDAIAVVDAFAVGEFYVRSADIAPDEVPIVLGAGAIGLSAVAALATRGIGPTSSPTTAPSAGSSPRTSVPRSWSTRPSATRSRSGPTSWPSGERARSRS